MYLDAALDSRAPGVIARAHAELQTLAARIADATTRSRVLNNLPHHREIVAAWQALNEQRSPSHATERDA